MCTTDLIVEPDQLGLLVLLEHAKLRIQNVLQQQHEELLLHPSCIHTLLTHKLHLGGMEGGRGGREGEEREGRGGEGERRRGRSRVRKNKWVGGTDASE